MAESTRSKVSSDHLEEAIVKITSHQLSLSENLNNITLKLDELIHKINPGIFQALLPRPPQRYPLWPRSPSLIILNWMFQGLMEPILSVGSSRSTNFSHTMKLQKLNASPSLHFIWRVMLLLGSNGWLAMASSRHDQHSHKPCKHGSHLYNTRIPQVLCLNYNRGEQWALTSQSLNIWPIA